ncbi:MULTISPECIES: serine hydrolase [unclassified Curtobacterium]|uniref:serine hydrolase n=1 Tax=unclassified Curtobacterium TaxID=257496 RepID=UPI00104EE505|nr:MULTISPECIES: serine hydrolase [unclassified Curtobacterium]MBF4586958.1 serine hydrolase [Curtobacterium sp. VKM Ac-2887]TCL77058.1 beta-lactamase class A [Curtobacterium sp. PhB128]TCL88532.1 beta-lactamase class A [Curtobacterium sp. PhB142]TCL92636.1 beta-lactamase class A [Curtobacterium sp. PhB138]TCM04105.1 beta-lactamase class A [Curtobacterium sp. PhB134]
MVEPDAARSSRRRRPEDRSGGGGRARGRHSGRPDDRFGATTEALGALALDGAGVSASVIDTSTGKALLAIDDTVVQPVASLGRVLLLIEVAAQLEDGRLHGDRLQRMARDTATGAGLWQFLQEPTMQVPDLATLVGATGDTWAMNALLSTVGIDAVRERAESLGIERTALIDRVRDRRGPDDAPDASVAPTGELAWVMRGLALGEVVDEAVSNRVLGWLSLASDLNLVAGSFGLDPLAHRALDHGLQVVAVTGSSTGVRAEAGILRGPGSSVSYAVTVTFDDASLQRRLAVIEALRTMGTELLEAVHAPARR